MASARLSLCADAVQRMGGSLSERLRADYPASGKLADSPSENPDDPKICFANAVFWLHREKWRGIMNLEALEEAQGLLLRECRKDTLAIYGYNRPKPEESWARIPVEQLDTLEFSVIGGHPGRDYYGEASFPTNLRNRPNWSGVFFYKRDLLAIWQPPPAQKPSKQGPRGVKGQNILRAAQEIWPTREYGGLMVQQRHDAILSWHQKQKLPAPSTKHIQRVLDQHF